MIAAPAGKYTEMVGEYMMEKIPGLKLAPGMYQAMMIVDDDHNFVGGVTFTNYRDTDGVPTDIEISCAADHPAAFRPSVCRAVFKYVFETVGVVRCTSITTKANRKARDFLQSLGFELEGRLKQAYDGKRDALVYGLLRAQCRFLDEEGEALDGEKERTRSAPAAGPSSDGPSAGTGEPERSDHASEPEQG
jgi:RimJ/RimL family protein N-acetyltransferase